MLSETSVRAGRSLIVGAFFLAATLLVPTREVGSCSNAQVYTELVEIDGLVSSALPAPEILGAELVQAEQSGSGCTDDPCMSFGEGPWVQLWVVGRGLTGLVGRVADA